MSNKEEVEQGLISFDVDVEPGAVNKSTDDRLLLQQIHPEIKETNLKFNEVYSFSTFKTLYDNVKLLISKDNSRENFLN